MRIIDIQRGDKIYTPGGYGLEVLATRVDKILPSEQHHLVTVLPHACGLNQPSVEVLMTRHHAIRCPDFMQQWAVNKADANYLHTFPDRLPAASIRFGDVTDRVCHIDIGDPEVPLVAEGMLAESWDGRDSTAPREYMWKVYRNTPFVQRFALELRDSSTGEVVQI